MSFLRLIILLNHRVVATFINIVKFGGRMRDYWSIGRSMILGISLAAAGCIIYPQPRMMKQGPERIQLEDGISVELQEMDMDSNGSPDALGLFYYDSRTRKYLGSVDRNLDGRSDLVIQRQVGKSLERKIADDNFDGFFEEVTITDKDQNNRILQQKHRYIDGSVIKTDYSLDETKVVSLYLPQEKKPVEIKVIRVGKEPYYWMREFGWVDEEDHQKIELWRENMGQLEDELDRR